MIKKLQAVALDCPDPVRLAEFYAELLGGRVVMEPEDPDWVEVVGFEGTPLAFQRVDGYRPPSWPGQEHPQQVHLDFDVDDIEADEKQVLELGARSFQSAVLVEKRLAQPKPINADFVGLTIEDRFVFGCGMDAKGFWRNLPEIRAMRES